MSIVNCETIQKKKKAWIFLIFCKFLQITKIYMWMKNFPKYVYYLIILIFIW